MVETKELTPQERASMFAQMTRQNFQLIKTVTGSESGEVSIDLPKVRLLGRIQVAIEATLNAKHSSESVYAAHADAPFNFLKRAYVTMNDGLDPFSISGNSLYPYNCTINGVPALTSKTSGRGNVVQGLTASSGGTDNTIRFNIELPIMLNRRDPIGLYLLQNDETLCTIKLTLGTVADLAPAASGFTFALSNIKVSLSTETFVVPALRQALPDIAALKMVQEKTEQIIAGENIIKLPIGQIYRKIGLIFYDSNGVRMTDADITSNFEILFNTAQIPYKIRPIDLAMENSSAYDGDLPAGCYVFDFSNQGSPNFGTARDYIDSGRLTELWIKCTSGKAGTVKVWYETLSMLKQG